jgi:hypothetical protein
LIEIFERSNSAQSERLLLNFASVGCLNFDNLIKESVLTVTLVKAFNLIIITPLTMPLLYYEVMEPCGYPEASNVDIDSWNKLKGGASLSAETEIKVGLFSYDISCFANRCIEEPDKYHACSLV